MLYITELDLTNGNKYSKEIKELTTILKYWESAYNIDEIRLEINKTSYNVSNFIKYLPFNIIQSIVVNHLKNKLNELKQKFKDL